MNPSEGTKDNPVKLDPFQLITKVQWPSGICILEIVYTQLNACRVTSADPGDPNQVDNIVEEFDDATCTQDDYKDKYVLGFPVSGILDTIVVDSAIVGQAWFVTGAVIGPLVDPVDPDHPAYDIAYNQAVIDQGRGPDFHIYGGVAVYTTVSVTREDGSIAEYVHGYTVDSSGANASQQDAEWYSVRDIPALETHIVRRSWLVNFSTDKVKTAQIFQFGAPISYNNQVKFRLFPSGTKFTIDSETGIVSGDKKESKTVSITIDSLLSGVVKKFDKSGFIAA